MSSVDSYRSPDEQYFVLALIVVFVVITVKLIRIWFLAPPFRRSLPSDISNYRKRVEVSVNALAHWLWLPIFFWLFLSCHRLYNLFGDLEMTKTIPISATMGNLRDLTTYFSLALSATAYAFLIRWNLLVRLTKLRD